MGQWENNYTDLYSVTKQKIRVSLRILDRSRHLPDLLPQLQLLVVGQATQPQGLLESQVGSGSYLYRIYMQKKCIDLQ